MNRDSPKTKGGLNGITDHKNAVHRWILSHHTSALISNQCEMMAGKLDFSWNHEELDIFVLTLNMMNNA